MGSSKLAYGAMGMCAFMMAMILLMAGGVAGQTPAAAPSSGDCDSVVLQLVDCLGYVSGSVATPPATCCSNLSAIIDSTPQCLCQLYNTSFTEPLGVNITRALSLPPACKLTTPDPSLCSVIGIPVSGPTAALTSPASAPSPASTTSGVPTPSVASPSNSPSTAPSVSTPVGATAPNSEMQPSTNTSSPPEPSGAASFGARSFAAASSLLFALGLLFH